MKKKLWVSIRTRRELFEFRPLMSRWNRIPHCAEPDRSRSEPLVAISDIEESIIARRKSGLSMHDTDSDVDEFRKLYKQILV
jgi:hypothetical protein